MSQPQVQPQVEQPQAEGARELSQPQSQVLFICLFGHALL
jgi:hypothetical protein